jgi:PAS domain S-box-containing protein
MEINKNNFKILLIEDNPGDADLIREMLPETYAIEHVTRLHDALSLIAASPYDMVFADLGLPDSQGLETIERIFGIAKNQPVIVLTGLHDEEIGAKAISLGAQDFLVKGEFTAPILIRSIRYALERKHAEDAIRHAASQWQTTFDSVNDAIMLLDTSGRIIRCNRAFTALVDQSFDSVVGSTCWKLMHGTDGPIEKCPVAMMKKSLQRESLILPVQDKWFKVVADPIFDDLGELTGAVHIMTDITEYKNTERELILNEKRIKSLLEMNAMTEATEEEICNFALEAMVELTSSEGGYLHLFDDKSKAILLTSWSKNVLTICGASKGLHYPIEKAGIWADPARTKQPVIHNDFQSQPEKKGYPEGHFPVLRHMSIPVLDGEKVVAIAGVGNKQEPYTDFDVVQLTLFTNNLWKLLKHVRDQKTLVESEDRFRSLYQQFNALLDANPDMLMLISPEMKILWSNRGAEVISGLSRDELAGKICYQVLHAKSGACENCPIERCFRSGQSESSVLTSTGGIVRDIRAVPIKDAEGKVVSVIDLSRDITDHRKLEEQFRQSQKMEAIGQLAGGVAHDFNNILSAIIGYGNLAEMKLPDDHAVRHDLEQILRSADRAAALTQSLLAFSRKQPIRMELIGLNEVISKFEKFLLRLLREDIELTIQRADEELIVMADRGQIEQVIMNLVTNARDAMPGKGRLLIETALIFLNEDFSKSHGYGRPGEFAMISVSDTGMGMDEKTKQKIFEPFFTTKEIGKGTGLGLATVYGIVKSHGGFINVYSEPGRGTAFKIYLPVTREAAEQKIIGILKPAPLKGGTETILVAEDDDALRKLTTVILSHMGYRVIEAMDGNDAVEKFINNKDAIKLVILDGIMPGLNGKEVYREIAALRPDMRCIFISGYAEDIFTKDGIPIEKVDFLMKPITPSVLLNKVREVLDR